MARMKIFTATVEETNNPAQTVTWTVIGSNNNGTGISDIGELTVASDETAPTLTVRATSTVDNTKWGEAVVTVIYAEVSNVAVSPIGMILVAGTTVPIKATVTPANANQNVTWSSGNTAIATVDNDGNVTGKAACTTDITGTAAGGKKATCDLKVIKGTSVIEGTVQQSGYQPTDNITVALYMQQASGFTSSVKSSVPAGYVQVAVTTPDATGKYRFANLPDGDYVVVVSVSGKESTSGTITVTKDENVPNVNFTLDNNGTVTTNPVITRVAVSSAASAVKQGATLQFAVVVEAHGGASPIVTWGISGNDLTATSINAGGLLTVAKNEAAKTLTITATSDFDKTKKGTVTVSVETVTGTDEHFSDDLKIFPNPFEDAVQVKIGEMVEKGKGQTMQLRITNAAGVVMHTQIITSDDEIIRLEQLPTGVYFFTIEKGGRTKTVRVVKN